MNEIRIAYYDLLDQFKEILLRKGFTDASADSCARIFADNSLDGVYSHGVNRFPRFIRYIEKGYIHKDAEPVLVHSAGALEQWNGNLGPGPLNATSATTRAMELAQLYGLGCVGLANTNHWMRGGTYARQAARKGFAFIGWTNTEANMPAWGSKDVKLGNNPLVLALPYEEDAIVLDFAMTQYSYGRMEATKLKQQNLAFPGGYSQEGDLTTDPHKILQSRRALPIGYWKGAGLSLLLDILSAVLSGGLATNEVSRKEAEYGLSQVFIAFDLNKLDYPLIRQTIHGIIEDFKQSAADEKGSTIRYPGERVKLIRNDNLKNGIPVNPVIWDKILALKQ